MFLPRVPRFVWPALLLIAPLYGQAQVVDPSSKLELISDAFELADGPAWNGVALLTPDVKAGHIYRYSPRDNKVQPFVEGIGRISASYFSHGRLFLSDNGRGEIAFLRGKRRSRVASTGEDSNGPRRPNDLVVDSRGGVYYTLTRQSRVMYIPSGTEQVTAVDEIDTPNGIALSPDGSTLYVASYAPKKIWAYDVEDDGRAIRGRIFAVMDDGPAKGADGMTVDRAGNVYCAGATDVWIWSPAGKLIEKIATPTRPINCSFGDPDMRSLYITGFGGLYRQRMRIAGRPPQPPTEEADIAGGDGKRPSTAIPSDVKPHFDVVFAKYGDRKLLMDIFEPQGAKQRLPSVVVVHGGGWLAGDKSKFRALAVQLARRGYVTAAIEYRLGGEALFPAGIHDCNAATRFLRSNAAKYNIDPQHIGAVGGSAGGHLVGLMAAAPHVRSLQGDGGSGDASSHLQAAIVMAGPLQMTTGSVAVRSREQPKQSNANRWLGKSIDEAPALYKLAAPFQHFSKQSPPMLFMCGEHDQPTRNQPSREKLTELGVWTDLKVYEDGKHGCWNQNPWFDRMLDDIDDFFENHLTSQ